MQVGNTRDKIFMVPEALVEEHIEIPDNITDFFIGKPLAEELHRKLDTAINMINHSQERMAITYEDSLKQLEEAVLNKSPY